MCEGRTSDLFVFCFKVMCGWIRNSCGERVLCGELFATIVRWRKEGRADLLRAIRKAVSDGISGLHSRLLVQMLGGLP